MSEKSLFGKAVSYVTGSTSDTVAPNTTETVQPVVPHHTDVAPPMPSYMEELRGYTFNMVKRQAGYDGIEHKMRLLSVTPKELSHKDGIMLCFAFELLDYRDTVNKKATIFVQEQRIWGYKATSAESPLARLPYEFAKCKAYDLLAISEIAMLDDANAQLFAGLEQLGYNTAYLQSGKYKPAKIVTKWFHILRDCGMLERFHSECQFNIDALKGEIITARISSRGWLMSLTGEEQGDEKSTSETAPTDEAGVADYGVKF